ncbi:hypothetical protein [Roseateles sp. PN1]|uniref:hypothetical protein n=1 Tax=Roseateles sp. PN1 TaxID=3137372 RepID=UPI00313860DB
MNACLILLLQLMIAISLVGYGAKAIAQLSPNIPVKSDISAGGFDTTPDLRISLAATGRSVMYEPIPVVLSLENRSAHTITLQSIDIKALAPLSRIYERPCLNGKFDSMSIEAGATHAISCELLPAANSSYAFLIDRETDFRLSITYKIAARSAVSHTLLPIKIGRPETHVIWGAAAGVALLSVFLSINGQQTRKARQPKPTGDYCWGIRILCGAAHWICRLSVGAIGGAITACMLLVFAQSTKGVVAPVAISVNDFWGGLAIGFFSIPISRWLSRKLQASNVVEATTTKDS